VSNVKPVNHGTYGGYQVELRRGLEPCDPCRAANRNYMASLRTKKRQVRDSLPPSNPAYPLSRTLPGAMKRLLATPWDEMTAAANASLNHVSKRCPDCGYLRTTVSHRVACGGEA
jgi:hypothetical protein